MGLLGKVRVPKQFYANAPEVSQRMIESASPEDAALMEIKQKWPDLWRFMVMESSNAPKPMEVLSRIKAGRHPEVMMDDLMERSQRAHNTSFTDATGIPPPHTLKRY